MARLSLCLGGRCVSWVQWMLVFGVMAVIAPVSTQAATLTVTNLNDVEDGSLRQILQTADSGDVIEFDAGLSGVITLSAGSMNITSDVTIVGPGIAVIAVDGNEADRIFTATNVNVMISGLTFANGKSLPGENGGFLYQQGGTMLLSNCVFMGHRSVGTEAAAGGFGGAICMTGGVISVYECLFSNNAAVGPAGFPQNANYYAGGGGGGAGLGGAICLFNGTGALYQCVFASNNVVGGAGGHGGWDDVWRDGGHGGGPAGGAGGVSGHADGYDGGEFSGGGGGKVDGASRGGNGGFGGGGGGAGAYSQSAPAGSGGQYGGNGSMSAASCGGGGGGGAGLGGAVFVQDGELTASNALFAGNSALGGNGGDSVIKGGKGGEMGGAFFSRRSVIQVYATVFSNNYPNAGDDLIILGTNGVVVGNDDPADADKGTDFGEHALGAVVTNVLTITNVFTNAITIGAVTTNGAGAAAFQVVGLPANLPGNAVSNFAVIFSVTATGHHACVVSISNSSIIALNQISLAGTGVRKSQTITNFVPTNGSTMAFTMQVGLSAQAGSGLPVVFTVANGPGSISGGTNLSFNSTGLVSVVASQAGNEEWKPAPGLTNVFSALQSGQAALIFNPTSPQAYNTSRPLTLGGGSGTGTVSFTVLSGPGLIVGGTNLTVSSGTGAIVIRAAKAGDALYHAAATTAQVACARAAQSIVFPAIPEQLLTNTVTLSATAGSGLPVTFTVQSGPGKITGARTLTFTGVGTVAVAAQQAGDTNWNASVRLVNSVNVLPLPFGSLSVVLLPAEAVAGGAMWRVDGGAWRASGAIVTGLTVGAHTVGYMATTGYNTPANQTVTIQKNKLSSINGEYVLTAGDMGYVPLAGDYDGDRKADPGVYRPSGGLWQWRMSYNVYAWLKYSGSFGQHSLMPLTADFDGDRKADLGLYNLTNGVWRARLSASGYSENVMYGTLGGAGWIAVPADFDGDRKADPAIYSPTTGSWKARLSTQGYATVELGGLLGGTGYKAAAGDLDGDGLGDLFVCNMSNGSCKVMLSSMRYVAKDLGAGYLGQAGGVLLLADYDGDGLADPAFCDPATGTLKMRLSSAGYQMQTLANFLRP